MLKEGYWRNSVGGYRRQGTNQRENYDRAQIAIMDVIRAFHNLIPAHKIIHVVGSATSPNAVSRALRDGLPRKYLKRL